MGAAVRRPFVLSAPGVRVVGDELAGVERVESGGAVLALRVGVGGASPASNIVVAPRQSRRELLAGGRSLVETIVLPLRTAGAVLQWMPGPGPDADVEVEVEVPSAAVTLPENGGCVSIQRAGGGVALCRLHPVPSSWHLDDPAGPGTVRVRARVEAVAGQPVTLLVAGDDDATGAESALAAVARARVHERRAEAALDTARRDRPAIHTGVSELDDSLEWAKARLEGHGGGVSANAASAAAPGGVPNPAVGPMSGGLLEPLVAPVVALGLAAAGDHDAALATAREIPRSEPGALIAMAWAISWVGGATGWSRAEVVEAGREAGRLVRSPGGSPLERVLARAAVGAAADLLGALGDRRGSEVLLEGLPAGPIVLDSLSEGASGEGAASGEAGRRAVTLPVLGGASARGATPAEGGGPGVVRAWGTAALAGAVLGVPTRPLWSAEPQGPAPETVGPGASPSTPRALEAWAHYCLDRPAAGYLLLREHLAEACGPTGARGCWGYGAAPDDPVATALVPILVLHGLLGARPDAPFGRLRLAPALPASWTRFRVTGVRLGRAVLELDYRRDGGRHTFVLRPTGGPLPPNLVFEPAVPGPITRVEVDDEPSDVGPEAAGDRVRASLQIPLDRERKVSLAGPDA